MSDNEIRQILIERKRREREMEKLRECKACVEGIVAFASLFFICFMISVIGG